MYARSGIIGVEEELKIRFYNDNRNNIINIHKRRELKKKKKDENFQFMNSQNESKINFFNKSNYMQKLNINNIDKEDKILGSHYDLPNLRNNKLSYMNKNLDHQSDKFNKTHKAFVFNRDNFGNHLTKLNSFSNLDDNSQRDSIITVNNQENSNSNNILKGDRKFNSTKSEFYDKREKSMNKTIELSKNSNSSLLVDMNKTGINLFNKNSKLNINTFESDSKINLSKRNIKNIGNKNTKNGKYDFRNFTNPFKVDNFSSCNLIPHYPFNIGSYFNGNKNTKDINWNHLLNDENKIPSKTNSKGQNQLIAEKIYMNNISKKQKMSNNDLSKKNCINNEFISINEIKNVKESNSNSCNIRKKNILQIQYKSNDDETFNKNSISINKNEVDDEKDDIIIEENNIKNQNLKFDNDYFLNKKEKIINGENLIKHDKNKDNKKYLINKDVVDIENTNSGKYFNDNNDSNSKLNMNLAEKNIEDGSDLKVNGSKRTKCDSDDFNNFNTQNNFNNHINNGMENLLKRVLEANMRQTQAKRFDIKVNSNNIKDVTNDKSSSTKNNFFSNSTFNSGPKINHTKFGDLLLKIEEEDMVLWKRHEELWKNLNPQYLTENVHKYLIPPNDTDILTFSYFNAYKVEGCKLELSNNYVKCRLEETKKWKSIYKKLVMRWHPDKLYPILDKLDIDVELSKIIKKKSGIILNNLNKSLQIIIDSLKNLEMDNEDSNKKINKNDEILNKDEVFQKFYSTNNGWRNNTAK